LSQANQRTAEIRSDQNIRDCDFLHNPTSSSVANGSGTKVYATLPLKTPRKKVEALFAELKNQIGLRRLRLRRMKFVREQFFLAAAA